MSAFDILISVLQDLYQAHQEMIDLANYKKQILIKGNIEELTRVMNLESQWIKHVGKLEDERVVAVKQLLDEKGITLTEVTLQDLVKVLTSTQEKEQIKQISEKLNTIFDDIKKANEVNTLLIQQSLDYISNSIELVMGEPKQSFTYGNPTTAKQPVTSTRRGLFDQKA